MGGPLFSYPAMFVVFMVFVALLVLLFIFVQVGLITLAFGKLGLTNGQGFLILLATLLGSSINIPIYTTDKLVKLVSGYRTVLTRRSPLNMDTDGAMLVKQIVSINVGGCLIPLLLSFALVYKSGITTSMVIVLLITTAFCYITAKAVEGVGVVVPLLLPPIVAAISASIFSSTEEIAVVAYVAGTIGTLLGADIMHLAFPKDRDQLTAPIISIGGAGTFDAIFLTGIIAALLV